MQHAILPQSNCGQRREDLESMYNVHTVGLKLLKQRLRNLAPEKLFCSIMFVDYYGAAEGCERWARAPVTDGSTDT